jgi:hypothetical protein
VQAHHMGAPERGARRGAICCWQGVCGEACMRAGVQLSVLQHDVLLLQNKRRRGAICCWHGVCGEACMRACVQLSVLQHDVLLLQNKRRRGAICCWQAILLRSSTHVVTHALTMHAGTLLRSSPHTHALTMHAGTLLRSSYAL